MLKTYLVIEHFVLLFHTRHECILAEICGFVLILGVCSLDLFFQGLNIGRQQPSETEFFSLLVAEGTSLVEIWCLKQSRALWLVSHCDHFLETILTVTAHSTGLFVDRGRSLNLLLLEAPCFDILAVMWSDRIGVFFGTIVYTLLAVLIRSIRTVFKKGDVCSYDYLEESIAWNTIVSQGGKVQISGSLYTVESRMVR